MADDATDPLIARTVSSIRTARAALDRGAITYRHEAEGEAALEKGEAKTHSITTGSLVGVGNDSFDESQTYGRILTETRSDYENANTPDETTTYPEYEYIHLPGFLCAHRFGKDCLFSKRNAFPPNAPSKPHRLFPPVVWLTIIQNPRFHHDAELELVMPTKISRDEKNPNLAIVDSTSTNGWMHSQYIIELSRAGIIIQFRYRSTMKGQDWHEHKYNWVSHRSTLVPRFRMIGLIARPSG